MYGSLSPSGPSFSGTHQPGAMPCGKKMPTKRCGRLAATVCANAVAAGIIESSSGRPSIMPAPRRNVRRGKCFLVRNIYLVSPGRGRFLRLHVHLERFALHDVEHERRESVVAFRGVV